MHGRRPTSSPHLFEEESSRQTDQTDQREDAEDIDVSEQSRLPHERLIHRTVSLLSGRHDIPVRGEVRHHLAHTFSKHRIVRRQMRHHRRLMRLRSTSEHRRNRRNPKAAAHVAHQVIDAGGVADLLVSQGARREHRQRNEYKPQCETTPNLWPRDAAHRDLQINIAEKVSRDGEDGESEYDQIPPIDLTEYTSNNNHRNDRADTAWTHCESALQCRVTEQRLQEQR